MHHALPGVVWRKASRSTQSGECVEVADLTSTTAVRDSKDPSGPVLAFSRGEFAGLLAEIKAGRLDV